MPFVKTLQTNSLSVKIIGAYIAGVVLSVLIMVLVVEGFQRFRSPLLVDEDISEHAEDLAEGLRFDASGVPVGLDIEVEDLVWIFDSLKADLAYRVFDASGHMVLQSPAGDAFWTPDRGQIDPLKPGRFDFQRGGQPMRGATEVVEHQGQKWFVQFGATARLAELFRLEFALPFMGIGIMFFSLVMLFVFGLCAYMTFRHVLKPLREVSMSAAAISPRSLHARLQSEGVPTEIAPLVESFNRVLERVERGYRVQKEFMATAAHELKTPLALIRAQTELLDKGNDRQALLQDVEHMSRQVQQLLLLAETSETHNYSFSPVDVLEVVREATNYLQRMAEAAGVRLDISGGQQTVEWTADRSALFTLLKNLLENAIQHSPPGSVVCVAVGPSSLTVRDHGPGVHADELPKLFVRFWRGDHRRDQGAGLGLAICLEIAEAHGWTLSAQPADPADPGLRIVLASTAAGALRSAATLR